MALAAYRNLLRSTRIAFKGDTNTLHAARRAARDGFEANRSLSSPEELSSALNHAKDVATILRQNIVQGKLDESRGLYKLNIHEETERGDNDSIKQTKPPPVIEGKRNTLKNAKVGTF